MKKPILGVLILGTVAFGWWQLSAPASPAPQAPSAPQRTNRGAALDIKIPTLNGNEIIGKTAYDAKCAACHGENGAGVEGAAPPFIHIIYEPNHHGDMAFQLAVQNGVRAHHWSYGDMPPVKGLTKGDVGNIIAYIRVLQRENGIE